jgi:ABC-type multidrug transport system ATPase subunit
MDSDDTRPLIVDQPEENLDSESIFSLLSHYFRTAKVRRQVIVITHNPNLVVNTDADQVIIATAERKERRFRDSVIRPEVSKAILESVRPSAEFLKGESRRSSNVNGDMQSRTDSVHTVKGRGLRSAP